MSDILDHDDGSLSRQDRELTLGTGTILGIFFALIVLCGACFGGGYFMGHKAQPTPLTLADPSSDAITGNGASKPMAGSPSSAPDLESSAGNTAPAVVVSPVPKPAPVVRRPPPPPKNVSPDAEDSEFSAKASEPARVPVAKTVVPSTLLPSASPVAGAASSFIMVQVAAVSHQEDADLLIGALRGRGYAVMARKGSGDPLIHVQVGPFNNKPAAEAMRQRLIGDGYNAMLKY